MKGYLSVRETSYKWNVSERWVSKLAQDGRIPSVERFGRSWAIPEDAEKPDDPRKEKGANMGAAKKGQQKNGQQTV